MVLGHVQVARAEQDGEQGQGDGDDQRRVLRAGTCLGHIVAADQQVDAEHDALELQGDVGQDADQADQRHHDCQHLRFAVAGGDEVGDRGDVLLLTDQDHLLQHLWRQQQQQDRPQVDRQEGPQLFGRLADRAEECPAGAVDRQRQAVDPGPYAGRHRFTITVAIEGDGEQNSHVGKGDQSDQPTGQRHANSKQQDVRSSRPTSIRVNRASDTNGHTRSDSAGWRAGNSAMLRTRVVSFRGDTQAWLVFNEPGCCRSYKSDMDKVSQ